jgi:predicted O-methyltransferase YrrM
MHLTCIDNWSYISGSEKTFDNNVKEFGGRVRKLKMDSAAGLSQLLLEKASFSFVYVDGCHEGFTAVLDMLISWRMLMVGGFMVVDDIRWTDPKVRIPPRIAWKAFALLKPPGLEVVHVFRQVIARKTCM